MGTELLTDPEVAELCDRCSAGADIDLRHLLVGADDDELRLTQNAQPALCFMGLGLTLLLKRRAVEPAAAAGHSIGEYAALAAGGAVGAPQVIKAVVERGRAMAEAVPAGTSSMAAVLGLDAQAVEVALAGMSDAWPANYNNHGRSRGGRTAPAGGGRQARHPTERERSVPHASHGPRRGAAEDGARSHRMAVAASAGHGQPHGTAAPGR